MPKILAALDPLCMFTSPTTPAKLRDDLQSENESLRKQLEAENQLLRQQRVDNVPLPVQADDGNDPVVWPGAVDCRPRSQTQSSGGAAETRAAGEAAGSKKEKESRQGSADANGQATPADPGAYWARARGWRDAFESLE